MSELTGLNTFGIRCQTQHLYAVSDQEALVECSYSPDNWLILGGGSNILFIDGAPEHVLHVNNQGIHYQDQGDYIEARVSAGENWHGLVDDSLSQGYSGLENLALIPGKAGAAPIQNIGAYGVELSDRLISLDAWNFKTGQMERFTQDQCQFGYRDSFFKTDAGRHYCIWEIHLRLDKTFEVVLGHAGLLALEELQALTARQVFDEISRVRRSKLPDPAVTANAGSFFKNPVIDTRQYGDLLRSHPNIVAYPQAGGYWKLAAGWLIDQAGLKGYRQGDAGIHDRQALVLVNHGQATGLEIARLAKHVQSTVFDSFGVMLEPEVNIIGSSGRMRLDDIE